MTRLRARWSRLDSRQG